MDVHLVDGTYELFRQFFGRPGHLNSDGMEVGATRAVLRNTLAMLDDGATHVGVATDSVIESFRNDLYEGYKDGSGLEPLILAQIPLLDDGLRALGVATFGMIEYEADDALGSAAAKAEADPTVDRVLICTPDKDMAQCVTQRTVDGVTTGKVVQFDRRKEQIFDYDGVIEKFGVRPESIPDYLGLVGDTADGFPGLPGWGAKSAGSVLFRYPHIEDIPLAAGQWDITVRGGAKLAKTLADHFEEALLFRRIATLDLDAPTIEAAEDLRWTGANSELAVIAAKLDAPDLVTKANTLAQGRS